MYSTPVIVFGFNRKYHLSKVLEALMNNTAAPYADVYIYIDKPLDEDTDNQIKNAEVLRMLSDIRPDLERAFKNVKIIAAYKHLGCRDSIIGAVDEIIHQYGRAIMVEDDILTSKYFLKTMDEMLTFYENDSRVFEIGGYSENLDSLKIYDKDVYALYRTSSWGWATWADRFDSVDFSISYESLKDKEAIKRLKRGGSDLPGLLKNEILGISDAWDVKFAYAMAKQDKIAVFPTKTLTNNIGFDDSGTHCSNATRGTFKQQELSEIADIKLEPVDVVSKIADEFYARHSYDYFDKIKRNFNPAGIKKAFLRFRLLFLK